MGADPRRPAGLGALLRAVRAWRLRRRLRARRETVRVHQPRPRSAPRGRPELDPPTDRIPRSGTGP